MNRPIQVVAPVALMALVALPACKCGGSPADQPAAAAKPAPAATAPPQAAAKAPRPEEGAKPVGAQPPVTAKAAGMDAPAPASPPKAAVVGAPQRADDPAASKGKYAVVEIPKDVAAVEGRVVWSKDLPAPTSHKVPEDAQQACGPNQDRRVVARGGERGVDGAIVRLTGVSQGKAFVTLPGLEPKVTVAGCRMSPRALVMQSGGTLKIHNTDGVAHTFVGRRNGKKLFKVKVDAGATVDQVVKGSGFTELVGAGGRDWLRAWIHSGSHPYAQATSSNGQFRIASVLGGDTTVEVWHPPVAGDDKATVVTRSLAIDKWLTAKVDFDLAP